MGLNWVLSKDLTQWMVTDMSTRRQFLAGLLATGLSPNPTWAEIGSPAYLSSAAQADGSYLLCGIGADLKTLFEIPLPARGHAAAAHPSRPEAVAFARRPGTFAVVIDCMTKRPKARLVSPKGRHFYGHGVFSRKGKWLFTTENDYEAGKGIVGVWDVLNGYKRMAEFSSGGIGPHDIKRLPDTETLVVANGGIDTHPETGRTKLNIPDMAPNLSYIENGLVVEVAALGPELNKNSIRHLAVSAAGNVAFGMQWQGGLDLVPLVGLHRRGSVAKTIVLPPLLLRKMRGYVGSIAFTGDEHSIVATSPRGGVVQSYDAAGKGLISSMDLLDASGVAACEQGVVISSGTGDLRKLSPISPLIQRSSDVRWDNHLIGL